MIDERNNVNRGSVHMIRCGNQIRLKKDEIDWLFKLTGSNPCGIQSIDDLNSFVDQHLPVYDSTTPESKLLGMLLSDRKVNPETR